MKKGKITRFTRHWRKHPDWDMGTPPGGRRDGPRTPLRGKVGLAVAGLTLAIALIPPAVDAFSGFAKSVRGCRIVTVLDGDTIMTHCGRAGLRTVRMIGYDAPEMFRAQCVSEFFKALASTQYLRWLFYKADETRTVWIGQDQYGRRLSEVSFDGLRVAPLMIEAGYGRPLDGGSRADWCMS
ncbi:MAG: thermonuclease family protein [Pseudooceanicola sp.]